MAKGAYLGVPTQHTVRKCPNCSSQNIFRVQAVSYTHLAAPWLWSNPAAEEVGVISEETNMDMSGSGLWVAPLILCSFPISAGKLE